MNQHILDPDLFGSIAPAISRDCGASVTPPRPRPWYFHLAANRRGVMMRIAKAAIAIMAAALSLAGSARAADLPVKALAAPALVYDWTGFYLGANVGVSAGVAPITQTSTFLPAPPGPPGINNQSTHNLFGAIGGGQIGYNRQFGRFVAGIEADMQASGQRSDQSCLTFCDFNLWLRLTFNSTACSSASPGLPPCGRASATPAGRCCSM
jgi:hypothetical protein